MSISGKYKVLVAEDNPEFRELLEFALKNEGMEVVIAHDGVEALKSVDSESPDVLLTDINMPEKDGITLIREIREKESQVGASKALPIIAMSAFSDNLDLARKAGAAVGVDKINIADLLRSVKELLMRGLTGQPSLALSFGR